MIAQQAEKQKSRKWEFWELKLNFLLCAHGKYKIKHIGDVSMWQPTTSICADWSQGSGKVLEHTRCCRYETRTQENSEYSRALEHVLEHVLELSKDLVCVAN